METAKEEKVTKILDLPWELKKLLIKDFLKYVFSQLRFRHYVMFFSFWALAYQTRNLVATYLEFQTVVKVDISKPYTIDFPGTTFCLDNYHMVLKRKLAKRYPEILDKIKAFNETTEQDKIMKLWREYKQKAYDNSTLDEWFQLMVEPQMMLECKLILLPNYHTNRSLNYPDCFEFAKPYYSMPYGVGLCWTYFSQINPNDYVPSADREDWYRVDIPEEGKLASFTVRYDVFDEIVWDEAPPSIENENSLPEIYVIVHHPRSMLSSISLDKAVVRRGTNFDIYFTQTNARMLPWPFKTDCIWYEKDENWRDFKSADHCIDRCLSKKVAEECGCIFNQSRSGRITKWAKPDSDYKFCKEYDLKPNDTYPEEGTKPRSCAHRDNYESYKTECRVGGKCKNNCFEEFYRYEVKEVFFDEDEDGHNYTDEFRSGLPLFPKARSNGTWATVNIIRKDIADVTYEHTPEMIFVEFVCYFGGLLGLWLGISVLDVYHQCLIWWDEAPIEYRKWLQRQTTSTNVQKFSAKKRNVSAISTNYSYEDNFNANIRSLYNTKY